MTGPRSAKKAIEKNTGDITSLKQEIKKLKQQIKDQAVIIRGKTNRRDIFLQKLQNRVILITEYLKGDPEFKRLKNEKDAARALAGMGDRKLKY